MVKPHVEYSEEIAQEICEAIASEGKGLNKLCKENSHWPIRRTIFRWLLKYPSFKDSYTRAKARQIEAFIDEVIEIADDNTSDYRENDEGKIVANTEHINRSRLRIDTRKWLASKLCPRLYGESREDKGANDDAISKLRIEEE